MWVLIAMMPLGTALGGLIIGGAAGANMGGPAVAMVLTALGALLIEAALFPSFLRAADLSRRSAAAMVATAAAPVVLLGAGALLFPKLFVTVVWVELVVSIIGSIFSFHFLGSLPPIQAEVQETIEKGEREVEEARRLLAKQ
ncbi:MAG: hypothetical protein U0793_11190 [Gemmataceae bacterium]